MVGGDGVVATRPAAAGIGLAVVGSVSTARMMRLIGDSELAMYSLIEAKIQELLF